MNRLIGTHSLLALALTVGAANAATVKIEPDDYTGDISNVAPGATLSTFRWNGANGYQLEPVFSVLGGIWSPTGSRVFGHRPKDSSEVSYHWDSLNDAYECDQGIQCMLEFYAFRVDFEKPTTKVSVLSTFRGEQAMDPVELSAFDINGVRVLRCRANGVDLTTLQTAVLTPPRYFDSSKPSPWGDSCGVVVEKKNCVGPFPGDCDYVVSLNVTRRQSDIAYVMFAGPLSGNTWAPVDHLSYTWLP